MVSPPFLGVSASSSSSSSSSEQKTEVKVDWLGIQEVVCIPTINSGLLKLDYNCSLTLIKQF